jgi:hypothetical protein
MRSRCVTIVALAAVAGGVHAQSQPSGKSLAATINVYVFPNNGQTASQQSKDEGECYDWAVMNTGSDPFDLQKKQSQQQQQTQQQVAQAQASQKGAAGRGFAGGAVTGALIGEIANDDAGQGAAWGAALGAASARRRAAANSHQAAASAEKSGAQKQAATAEQMDNFKKAMSVCLESKKYMVKY